jgi:hypothetical protein
MRRSGYCYFHDRWLNQPDDDTFPPFEDGNSVQFALMQIVERLRREAFRGGAVDPRLVRPLIFAVKTAAQNLRNTSFDPTQEQSLTVDPVDIPGDQDETVPLRRTIDKGQRTIARSATFPPAPAGDDGPQAGAHPSVLRRVG